MTDTSPITGQLPAPLAPPTRADHWARGVAILALLVALGVGGGAVVLNQRHDAALGRLAEDLSARVSASAPPSVPSVPVVDPARLEALAAEIADLRAALAAQIEQTKPQAALQDDVALAKTALAGLRGTLETLSARSQAAASAETGLRAQLVAYVQLRAAAATASPFNDELAALRAATADLPTVQQAVLGLEPLAGAGAATLPMLQARFQVMGRAARHAAEAAAAQSWRDRLLAEWRNIISIRKLDDDGGATPAERGLFQAAAALQRGELRAAIELCRTLPEAAQRELTEWLDDAAARLAVDDGMHALGAALRGGTTPLQKGGMP